MAGRGLARLGGVCGLLFVLLMVPAYVVGYPDAPTPTSLVALGTGVVPRWAALAGLVVALLTLLHFLVPLLGALAGLLWVALISALMLIGSRGASEPRRLAR